MNKIAIALSAALSLGAVASANAADGRIQFTGDITALTCDITVGGSGNTVTMPTITPETINGGAAARQHSFNIQMGSATKGCKAGPITVTFENTNVEANGRLKNIAAADDAKNVQLAIIDDATSDVLDLNSAELNATIGADGIVVFPMKASYEKSGAPAVTAGKFETAMEISVKY